MGRFLGAEQCATWQREGYLVLPGFKRQADVQALRARTRTIVEAFEPADQASVFSTRDQSRLAADRAFLDSARGIHCFFEEEAFDAAGRLRQAKALSINKIGHALHDLDPVFDAFSRGPELAALAHDLGLADPLIVQSMVIFKQPGIGGEVRWHQDATFLHDAPVSVTGLWFALEDATRDNGCLWVQPGGHRGPLREVFERGGTADAPRLALRTLDDTPWPDSSQAVPLEVKAGSLVCLHGLLPHWSAPNRSAQSRQAYSLHAVDARSRWSSANWLDLEGGPPLRGFDGPGG
jgi:phytanoyl-CoA hydroxylase